MSYIQQQAEAIANRVIERQNAKLAGMSAETPQAIEEVRRTQKSFATLVSLFAPIILSIVQGCLKGEFAQNPAKVQAAIVASDNKNPKRMRRRVRARLIAKAKKQNIPLTDEEKSDYAEDIIYVGRHNSTAQVAAAVYQEADLAA